MATPYRDAVVADAPVGYWKLDELAGTTAASVNNTPALDGTYTGTVTLGAADTADLDTGNKAITLVQTGYVNVPASALLNLRTALTIEAIINPTNVHFGGIYNHPTVTNGYNQQAEVFLENTGLVYFRLNGAGGQSDLTWDYSAAVGRDLHLVCSWDGTTQAIYVGGVVVASKASTCGTLNDGPAATARIGQLATPNFYGFNGMLDEIAVYSSALSSARILIHAQALNPGAGRVTQEALEAVVTPVPAARTTQLVAEAVVFPLNPRAHTTQVALEAVQSPQQPARITQFVLEVLVLPPPPGLAGTAAPGAGRRGIPSLEARTGISGGRPRVGVQPSSTRTGLPREAAVRTGSPRISHARTRTE